MLNTNVKSTNQPVIKCESVYKIFGDNAERLLREAKGNIDVKIFEDAGCIFGVNSASFEVYEGEILVIMGLSGSGKSTLLRCISRLTEATDGKIYIEGDDLLAMNSKELIELRRNKMGMVFQSFALLPHKTVLENIAFPLQVKGMSTQESISKASSMMELVGSYRARKLLPKTTIRWPTAACRYCPLARSGARYLVSGRTFFSPRPAHQKRNAGRVFAASSDARQNNFVCYP